MSKTSVHNFHATTYIVDKELYLPRNRYKLVVIGERGSGKSALIRRLVSDTFDETARDDDVADRVLQRRICGSFCKVELFEIDAESLFIDDARSEQEQQRLRKMTEWFDVSGVLLVYDICSLGAFERARDNVGLVSRLVPPACEICFVGTKCDLKAQRKVSFKEADLAAERLSLSLFEVSSRTGINSFVCLEEMVERAAEKRQPEVDAFVNDTVFPSENPPYPTGPEGPPATGPRPSLFCFKWWSS